MFDFLKMFRASGEYAGELDYSGMHEALDQRPRKVEVRDFRYSETGKEKFYSEDSYDSFCEYLRKTSLDEALEEGDISFWTFSFGENPQGLSLRIEAALDEEYVWEGASSKLRPEFPTYLEEEPHLQILAEVDISDIDAEQYVESFAEDFQKR